MSTVFPKKSSKFVQQSSNTKPMQDNRVDFMLSGYFYSMYSKLCTSQTRR